MNKITNFVVSWVVMLPLVSFGLPINQLKCGEEASSANVKPQGVGTITYVQVVNFTNQQISLNTSSGCMESNGNGSQWNGNWAGGTILPTATLISRGGFGCDNPSTVHLDINGTAACLICIQQGENYIPCGQDSGNLIAVSSAPNSYVPVSTENGSPQVITIMEQPGH